MKLIIISLFVFVANTCFAQGSYTPQQRKRDSLRLDSLTLFWNIRGPNSFHAKLAPKRLQPTSNRICFNKKFKFYVNNKGKISEGCFYVNTIDGYTAIIFDNIDKCDIEDLNKPYGVSIHSKFGESFTYTCDKKGRKYYSSTPAIQTQSDLDHANGSSWVRKAALNGHFEPFTDNNLPTIAYRNITLPGTTNYFFGNPYSSDLHIKNYLGQFGLGYYTTSTNRDYLCLAMEAKNLFVKVLAIEDVKVCFDGSGYKPMIDETIAEANIEEKKKRIDEKNADIITNNSPCAEAEKRISGHKLLMLEKEEAALKIKTSNRPLTTAELNIMAKSGDPADQVTLRILQNQLRICNINYFIQANSSAGAGNNRNKIEKLNTEMQCLKTENETLNELIDEMKRIDIQYLNLPAMAMPKKNVLFLQKLATLPNCHSR